MSKRLRRLVPITGAALLLLAACGESVDPRENTDNAGDDGSDGSDGGSGDQVTLLMESWRNDDLAIWEDVILPAFHEQHPDIRVEFRPTAPDEYDAALDAKLSGGTAGDLITCRPFDVSLRLYDEGHLAPVTDLPGMDAFDDIARTAWSTDDGSETYCVPMASVIHGFLYNKAIFDELGIEPPETEEQFHEVLDTIAQNGEYAPLVMGTADQWEAATMGLQNIGPNYWKGETGRKALIEGSESFDDPQYVDAFAELASWSEYLPDGYESITYPDAQNMFTLGRGAIYPTGSWEIALFNEQADFEMGAFPPPPPEGQDTCYVSDHTDIGVGMNAATEHPEAARTFLEWTTSAEFAELYANELPGFFPMSDHDVEVQDPLAKEFLSWRDECESTIRNSYQILSRGEPNLENQLWDLSAQVLNGTIEPQQAAAEAQKGLERWYEPQQK
ncbi:carbohydrate ABC transporter substrate-binding protein (CUT1 family) [Haloactinopolyspora alba]|uniref:Probable sugar-binding periplasmic protein n=1 Tax=Haloactinopolyspora alba TaxID=648780 RepID=A0A2P8E2J6_9ACTN|nr:ABC transporter substrate-binding protein [Haloactinopolyspora alba]PSL03704.1 carbohydrate ABC transporter substrate-binding protein (CUT1 family) [Haloactinopolyspora alba]